MSSHQVPSDLIKNPSGDDHKEQKVIVVSVKDMQSFKIKDIYGNQEGGQSIFAFRPQQLLQSTPGSSIHPIQVTQQVKASNLQVQPMPVQKIITTTPTPTQYVIRQQQPVPTVSIAPRVTTQQIIKQQHQQPMLSFVVSNTGPDAPKLISSQVTIQNKPIQSPPVQIAKKVIATPSQILLNPQQKTMQVVQGPPKGLSIPQKQIIHQQTMPPTFKLINKDLRQIPIVQATGQQPQQSQFIIKTQPSGVQSQSAWKQTKIIQLPAKPKVAPQKIISSFAEMPALAPIQRKIAPQPVTVEKIEADSSKDEEYVEPQFETLDEEFLDAKHDRSVEGDDDMKYGSKSNEKITHDDEFEEEEEEEKETMQSENENEQQEVLSSDSLLCDEQIASISPEESPNDKKDDEKTQTPSQTNSDVNYKAMATDGVKKTLNLDMPQSGTDEKIQLRIEVEEEDDSVISDDTNVSKNNAADNDDESLHSKSEISVIASGEKATKRSRKTKHPTVNPNLGLPFKPTIAQGGGRKKKTEKKMELEHDFHDPLNKIQWEDGIGGMNNCNKLFGFNDFGLVEVVTKKDARAKINGETFDQSNFKFRKILDPKDQFCCVVCSKTGTVRDFFSPECCSEACMAITKRKAFDYAARDDQHDSGQSSPTTDAKRVLHDGEWVPLQELQTFLLQQKLPGGKKNVEKIKPRALSMSSTTAEENFNWSTYLNAKSVPAAPEFFKNTRQQQTKNPFKVGMKMEAIDPKNQNLFCVCTVDERIGHRIKLHFDGYSSAYDFWVDAGSKNIFPIDFCRITKRKLQVPPKWPNQKNFDWSEYLDAQNSAGAPRNMFPHLAQPEEDCSMIRVGMKLEALKDDAWFAATIVDILNGRILVKFDGGHEKKKYAWYDFHSPYIGPCNGHKTDEDTSTFRPPIGTSESFSWDAYLKSTNSEEVPEAFFAKYEPIKNEFVTGMKLEVVDKANPQLIRPATILNHDDYKIQVNYDGFNISYAYWLDYDSEEIYPINYCKQTGHPIEFPARYNQSALCQTAGCRGIGNGIHPDKGFHERSNECPYRQQNWTKYVEDDINDRLSYKAQNSRRNKLHKENGGVEKRQSLLRPKKEVKEELESIASISTLEENFEEPPNDQQVQKRVRKRKSQPDTDDSNASSKIRVVENFLQGYGPQISYSYQLWRENSKILDKATLGGDSLSENPLKWTVDEVCTYLIKFCDEETSVKFYAQQIDGEALLSLSQGDLKDLMKIKMGPAIKINNRILHLRQEVVSKFLDI